MTPAPDQDPLRKMLADALVVAMFVVPSVIVLVYGAYKVAGG